MSLPNTPLKFRFKSQFFQVALEGVAAFYMADVGSLACLYIG